MRLRAGFTMIEAVVIIAVLAILAGILTPMVIREVAKAKVTRVIADMEAISTAFTQYYVDTGYWPEGYTGNTNEREDLVVFSSLYQDPGDLAGWDGPYLEKGVRAGASYVVAQSEGGQYTGLVDAWGTPYRVVYGRVGSANAGAGGAVSLLSAGPDKVFSTSDGLALRGEASRDDVVKVITRRVR